MVYLADIGLSRRRFLRVLAVGGLAASASLVAACGGSETPPAAPPATQAAAPTATSAAAAPAPTSAPSPTTAPKPTQAAAPTPAAASNANQAAAVQEVQYYIWGGQDWEAVIKTQVQNFVKANPNVKVVPQLYGTAPGQTEEALLTKIAGGVQVDLALTHYLRTVFFVKGKAAVALDDFPDWKKATEGVYPWLIKSYSVDGHVYAGPNFLNPGAPAYNVELVKKANLDPDKPPTTWDEFVVWAKALTNKDAQQFGTDIGPSMTNKWAPIGYAYTPYIGMLLGELVHPLGSDTGKATVGDAAGLTMADLFTQVYKGGYTFPGKVNAGGPSFTNGKVGMSWWAPPAVWAGWRREIADKFEWRLFPGYPLPPGAKYSSPVAQEHGGYVTLLLSNSKVREAAWKFLAFQISKDGQQIFANNTFIPVRSDVDMSEPEKQFPQLKVVMEQWEKNVALVDAKSYNTIEDVTFQAWQQIFINNQSPKDALSTAAKKMEDAWASGAT